MDIIINSTRQFEKDLKRVPIKTRRQVLHRINYLSKSARGKKDINLPTFKTSLIHGLHGLLYIFKIDRNYRAIISIDNDEILSRKTITLYMLVNPDNLKTSLTLVSKLIYRDILTSIHG